MAAGFCALHGASAVAQQGVRPHHAGTAQSQTFSLEGGSEPDEDFAELSLEELMDVQVVVTASRRAQAITSVPNAISVITADDIRAAGSRSIPDALRLVPGMDVADLSIGNAAVSPRGFHGLLANQVLVLVDGRQIFDSVFGGTLWGSWPFQLEDIARIEVIRGPGGVAWGANAVNGVINIITKDPADQQGVTLTTRAGSRGSFKQHVGYGFQEGKLRMRLSAEYEASDGFVKGGSFLGKLDDDYKGGRLSLHAVYDKDEDNTYTFSAGSAVVDGGLPPTPLASFSSPPRTRHRSNYILFNWVRRIGEDEHYDLTAFANDFSVTALKQLDYQYQQFGLQLAHTYAPDETRTRTWGLDSRVDLLDAGNADPFMLTKNYVSTAIVGLYLQDVWRFAPRWTLNLGGRIDYEFYGGFQPSARASLAYELSREAILYGSVSRAFQMPPAALRFMDLPLLDGLVHSTVDRDVEASTLIAYEVGYRGRLLDRIDTSVNLFWHDFDEVSALNLELGPPGLLQDRLANRSGGAAHYGAECELQYAVSDRLTLLGNYTYQQLNWDLDESITQLDFVSPPKHKAMLGARYKANDDLRLSAHLFFVGAVEAPNPSDPFTDRQVDPYLRLDLRVERELWNDQASIAVGVTNLLDRNHYEGSTQFLNDAEVPRMIYAEFRMKIK